MELKSVKNQLFERTAKRADKWNIECWWREENPETEKWLEFNEKVIARIDAGLKWLKKIELSLWLHKNSVADFIHSNSLSQWIDRLCSCD